MKIGELVTQATDILRDNKTINLNEKIRQKEFAVSTSFIKEMLKTFLLNYYETKRQLLVITMYWLIRAYRQAK